jgi:hypothetical protein
MEQFTGVRFDQELQEFEVVVCGEVETWANTAREAAAKLQEYIVWRATVASKTQAPVAPQPPAVVAHASLPAAPVKAAQTATARPRCCFHKAIRRCFAIAKDAGLDTRADEAMRAAFANYLCRDVPSRESLSGGDWLLVGNAIKSKRLAW